MPATFDFRAATHQHDDLRRRTGRFLTYETVFPHIADRRLSARRARRSVFAQSCSALPLENSTQELTPFKFRATNGVTDHHQCQSTHRLGWPDDEFQPIRRLGEPAHDESIRWLALLRRP